MYLKHTSPVNAISELVAISDPISGFAKTENTHVVASSLALFELRLLVPKTPPALMGEGARGVLRPLEELALPCFSSGWQAAAIVAWFPFG
jgi:hypothetical protein